MNEIVIREMKESDYNFIIENIIDDMNLEDFKKYLNDNSKSNSKWYYFVSTIDNEVVGIIFFSIDETRKHIARLSKALVSNKYQGKGIFKKMFNYIIEYIKNLSVEILITSVRKRCITETVYQKIGFIKYGELPRGFKNEDNTYTDEVLYYYEVK